MSQYYEHMIDVLKGWPDGAMGMLDCVRQRDPAGTLANFINGRVVHVDPTTNKFLLGAEGHQMPVFLMHNATDGDVANTFTSTSTGFVAPIPAGYLAGLVATGGFELTTTEFDTDAEFAPQDLLHSPSEATCATDADAGKLYNAKTWTGGGDGALVPLATHLICGVASGNATDGARYTNHNGVDVLQFYTVYQLANPTAWSS